MITSIPLETIEQQLLRQLSSFFFLSEEDIGLIKFKMKRVISRCEYCFSHTVNKYYSYNGETFFNPYQSAQYTIFLYYFANTISYETGNQLLADKLYYLNKIMNACDLYHEVELPDFFTLDHPVGSVMDEQDMGKGSVLAKIVQWEIIEVFILLWDRMFKCVLIHLLLEIAI